MQVPQASPSTVLRYLETEGQRPLEVPKRTSRKLSPSARRFPPPRAGAPPLGRGTATNRFSVWSGECPRLPVCGWVAKRVRDWLRRTLEGPDVMRLGIDFHQFTSGTVRQALQETGFARVYDMAVLLDPERLNQPTWW